VEGADQRSSVASSLHCRYFADLKFFRNPVDMSFLRTEICNSKALTQFNIHFMIRELNIAHVCFSRKHSKQRCDHVEREFCADTIA
jgi:hypothetical protein